MAISVKHAFQSAKADGPDSTLVQPSSWNAEHTITAAAGKVLGRDTSGAGAIQELPIAVDVSGNVALGGALSVDGNTTLGNASTDSVTVNAASFSFANATTIAGTITYSGAVSFNGNTTLGDASTDTVTLNANTVSIPNNVNFSGGNVGIGTSSPGAKLEVASSTSNIVLSSSTGGYAAFQRKAPAGQQTYDFYTVNGVEVARITGDGNNALWFSTGSAATERMRIDSAGNVGIGTTSPNITLFVQGAADVSYAPNPFNMRLRGTASATSGNSGSGIAFQGYTTGTSTASDLAFISGIKENTTDANYAGALVLGTRPNGSGGGNFERMRIDSAGNVGIATSAPQASLDVNGDIVLRNGVYFEMTAPASKSAAATLTGAEVVQGYVQYTGAAANLTLPTATNLQAAMPSGVATLNDIAFDFTVINTGSGTATLVVNTGITAVGALTTAAGTATTFHIRKTATNTFIVYRT